MSSSPRGGGGNGSVRLTAALIVRNEEAHLDACLGAAAAVANEFVVVDTGSTDRTPEIAVAHGARLIHEPWRDDFAWARNTALEHATGEWILYIDADERVALTGSLDPVLDRADALCGHVAFRAASHLTPYREYRLFRNRPDIRFRGVIHETVVPDIKALIAQGSGVAVDAPLFIDHLGYAGNMRPKHRRNLPLLRRAVVDDPERVYLWFALGEAELGLGDVSAAVVAWRQGLMHLRERRPQQMDAILYSALIGLHFGEEKMSLPDVDSLLEEAAQRHPGEPLILWWTARHYEARNLFSAARAVLEELLRFDPDRPLKTVIGYDRRLLRAWPQGLMGVTYLREGQPERALEWLRRAEASDPDNQEIRVKHALAEGLVRNLGIS